MASYTRLLVCGGRDYADRKRLFSVLDALQPYPTVVIHGAARGADSLAGEWARVRDIAERPFPADWKTHGKGAGFIRNRQMLIEGQPTFVVAFPGGRGTGNMIKLAKAAGVPVMEVTNG